MQSSEAAIATLTTFSAGAALLGAISLTILQSDFLSRKWLDTDRLQGRRTSDYVSRWRNALVALSMQISNAVSNCRDSNGQPMEDLQTSLLTSDEEVALLVEEIVAGHRTVLLGKIDLDEKIQSKEYFLWLYEAQKGEILIHQAPLAKIGPALADAMDRMVHSGTFCFVADIAAGQGSETLEKLICVTKSEVKCCINPAWLTMFAVVAQRGVYNQAKLKRIFYGLCRLQGYKSKEPTIMIAYGSSILPVILPIAYAVFPDDRHVLAYTGCIQAVQHALASTKSYCKPSGHSRIEPALSHSDPIMYTTPLSRCLMRAENSMPPMAKTLQKLPLHIADKVETWMAAVDAFFVAKEQEKSHGCLPYVLRLDFLWTPQTEEVRYWSTRSLLQFVTGSRSRGEIRQETLDAATSFLQEYRAVPILHANIDKNIEQCVFQHKSILIPSKTLPDTVQPVEHWTLKATRRGGCSCCAESDEEDENTRVTATQLDSGEEVIKLTATGGYVDGKAMFAFDPTKF